MQAFTSLGDTENLHRDLAWRWFTHPDKRSKVPVVPTSSLQKPLSWWVEQYPEKGPESLYLQWASDYERSPFFHGYTLVGFNDGADWDSTSINRDRYYEEWYNYFEDIQEGETPSDGIVLNHNRYSQVNAYSNFELTGSTQSVDLANYPTCLYASNSESFINGVRQIINSYDTFISTDGVYVYYADRGKLEVTDGTFGNQYFTVKNISGSSLTLYGIGTNQSSSKYWVLYEGQLYYYIKFSNENVTILPNNYQININNGRTYNLDNRYYVRFFTSGVGGGGGSSEPSEPVFPPTSIKPIGPIEPDSPSEPNYTEITNNYYEVTETDVDLQPIIDAIGKVNKNIQILAGNIDTLNDNLIDGFQTISSWFELWKEYTTALYDDLTDYLWRIEQLLNALLLQEVSEPNIEPALGPDESLSDRYDVNIELLKKKFPTSIPWDVYGILRLLNAPAQAPRFELPVVLTEYTVVIDFSQYETMAAVSRKMSVLLFAVGLLMVTKTLASIDIGAHHGN